MFATILCVAAVTLGVDAGWEPNGHGGLEYIVQIDPVQLESLKNGIPYRSDIPKDLRGVQTIRFQFGTEKPPRVALPADTHTLLNPLSVADPAKATPSPSDTAPPSTWPGKLATDLKSKPLVANKANFDDPLESDALKPGDEESTVQNDPSKPWPLLWGVAALAAGLSAAFVYLAWIHVGMRSRYRMLLAEHLAMTQPT